MRNYAAIMLATVAVLTSACGDQNQHTQIDVSKLDVGNNPTTPIDIESLRTPSSGATREAIAIGNHTPLPFEYDSRFGYGHFIGYRQRVTTEEPPAFEKAGITSKIFVAEVPGLVAGWRAFGQRRNWPDLGRNIETYTLRFETSDAATNAARKLADRSPGEIYRIKEYNDALVKVAQPDPDPSGAMRAWLTRNDMLVYIAITDPVSRPFDAEDNSSIATKFFDKQIEMLQNYHRTPLNEIPSLPIDIDGLLSRTMHGEKKNKDTAVYPARVAVSMTKLPIPVSNAYTDAGVDYVAISSATVYRARDAASAERLVAAFGNGALDLTGLLPADPPPNMPTAICYSIDPNDSTYTDLTPRCTITAGRYVARVGGANLQDTHQRAAAQYKLLIDLE